MGSCLSDCYSAEDDSSDGDTAVGERAVLPMAAVNNRQLLDCALLAATSQSPQQVDSLVLNTLDNIRRLVDVDQDPPRAMIALHMIAEKEEGWLTVVMSMVNVIPLTDPLGPAVILLLLDDCPLPSKELVFQLVDKLGVSASLVEASRQSHVALRNICVVLGCLAEKMAGPNAVALLTPNTLDFLLQILTSHDDAAVVLFALIALEKFAQTSENKLTIGPRLCSCAEHPLLRLQKWGDHGDFHNQQVALCAQWCLDNLFVIEGRIYTYESVDVSTVNAMLNCNDTSEYLKITPDGLQARCDASSFESVRCTFCAESGCWYYEVTVVTSGVMQIGWATKHSRFLNYEGYGIGDDAYSVAYDGCRRLVWHGAQARPHAHRCWRPGDVLGALLDIDRGHCVFFLNGDPLPAVTDLFNEAKSGFFAAASFMSFQQCRFNFGREPFQFPPTNHGEFRCFNDHASLTDQQRIVLPRQLKLELLRRTSIGEDACTLCFDRTAAVTLQPCRHSGFCATCADQLQQCPLCRKHITSSSASPPTPS